MLLLHQRLDQISDSGIHEVIADLLRMANLSVESFQGYSLFECLQTLYVQHGDDLKLEYLPLPGLLGERTEKLQQHGFYTVCAELLALKEDGTAMELYDRISLHSFLKKHFACHKKSVRSKRKPPRRW